MTNNVGNVLYLSTYSFFYLKYSTGWNSTVGSDNLKSVVVKY